MGRAETPVASEFDVAATIRRAPQPTLPGWCLVAMASIFGAMALPPFGLGLVGFLAPAAFMLLCLPQDPRTKLRVVFWWGLLQWMITFHFIRLPHWAGWIGWPILGGYFACYNVLLVAVSRRLIHRGAWPAVFALPVVWVSLEWLRSVLLTGFPMGQLGHSLYRFPFLIQTADLAGDLTVSFLMALIGSSMAIVFFWRSILDRLALGTLLLSLGIMMGYGFWKSSAFETPQNAEGSIRVALIQGARDVQFGLTAEEDQRETVTSFRSHQALTARAREANANLVIWAESMFPVTDVLPFDADKYRELVEQSNETEPSARPRLSLETLETVQREMLFLVRETTGTGPVGVYPYQSSVPLVVGMRSLDPLGDSDYNAAVYFDANSEVAGRYFKTHLVPFGEYLPLGETFPALYSLAPMPRGLTPGDGAKVFEVQGKRFLPTICYESVIGRLVRRYLVDGPNANPDRMEEDSTANELSRLRESSHAMGKTANGKSEQEPTNARSRCDALLNISNDGWFWGSSALDLHLASNVFRAVENRTPHLVVCNTGISAQIDASGRIVQEASKRSAELLMADVYPRPASWNPLWWTVGNGPWWVLTALIGLGLWRSAVGSGGSGRSSGFLRPV